MLLGLFFTLFIKNINEIWGWITMSIGAGLLLPMLARWYWWRLNGLGFSLGTVGGMVAAVVQKALIPGVPEYVAFAIASGTSLVLMVVGTYIAPVAKQEVLENFYKTTRPFGFWKPVRSKMPPNFLNRINTENRRDIISTFFAVPWQVVIFLFMMMLVMGRRDNLLWLGIALAGLSVGLYHFWFKRLSSEVKFEQETTDKT
ncbi:hypothetical protein A2V82_07865 [candidate division KSB1 bacterium RBG_16_48_16]|nr:MAG: hypothetical protein A2V82_07865 [candidate division KSB1 bacterium RBG_16_48_16]